MSEFYKKIYNSSEEQCKVYKVFPDLYISCSSGDNMSYVSRLQREGFDACGVYIFYEGNPEDEFQFLHLTLLIQQLGSPLLLSNIINYLRIYLSIHYNGREINFVNTLCASISNLQQNQLLTIFDVYISIFIRNPALIQSCEYDLPYQLCFYLRTLFGDELHTIHIHKCFLSTINVKSSSKIRT